MPKCDELTKVGDHKGQETLQTNSHLDQWPNKGRKEGRPPGAVGACRLLTLKTEGCSWSATKCRHHFDVSIYCPLVGELSFYYSRV